MWLVYTYVGEDFEAVCLVDTREKAVELSDVLNNLCADKVFNFQHILVL